MSTDPNPYMSSASEATGFSTGYQATSGQQILASRGNRFLAALIDGLILLVCFAPILGILSMTGILQSESTLGQIFVSLLTTAIGVAIYVLVNGKLLISQGQTWGKKIMKIRILRQDGTQANAQELILKRYIALVAISIIPYVGNLFVIVDALMIFRENRQCLHDDIAGTKVVEAL